MKEIIIIGTGGHATSCIDVLEAEGKFKIKGLIEKESSSKSKFMGYPILGIDKDLKKIKRECEYAFIGVGQIKNYELREKKFNELISLGFKIPFIISPNAYVSKRSKIELGTIVMHKVIVNSNVKIGMNCIINSRSLIEHDVEVEKNCHISTGTILNGGAKIGKNTFIGSGAILKEGIKVGENSIITAGSIVLKDIKNNNIYKNEK